VAYNITLTNGTVLTTIAEATVDTTTSLTLIGRNFAGYGGYVAENFVHMLENAANTSPPDVPLVGQLWYDTTGLALKIWDGSTWTQVGFDSNNATDVDVTINAALILTNMACPANQRLWRIRVSNSAPYIGMLVFEALNDNLTVRNTVMALDGVNDLIEGVATMAEYS
jgi:hypothetical protein